MPKVFVQVKPSESRIWNYITLTTPPTFYSELTMKLASRHHFNLVSLTGRKVEWFFVWEYRFLLWASPPPGLCHPMSYAPLMCRSSIARICLWLVSIFWLYIWKFQLFFHFMYFLRISYIFLLYFPPTPRFFSTSLPSGLPSYSFSALLKPQTPKKKQTKRKQNILENGLCWPAIVQGTFSGLWLLFSVLPRWKKKNIFPLWAVTN